MCLAHSVKRYKREDGERGLSLAQLSCDLVLLGAYYRHEPNAMREVERRLRPSSLEPEAPLLVKHGHPAL